jgi:hypothetical protein
MRPDHAVLPLWPLPLVAGALPAMAVLLALAMYEGAGGVSCNPFIDDCVSISRMARQGMANHIFRALVLPAAALQLLTWFVAARALADAGLARRDARLLAILGAIAGVALVLYATFLGTDGDVYRLLRRTGTSIYFGCTYLAMLLFARSALRLHAAHQLELPRGHARMMLAPLIVIALLIPFQTLTLAGPLVHLNDRAENLAEWWGSVAMTLAFVAMAAIWRRWGLGMTITLRR